MATEEKQLIPLGSNHINDKEIQDNVQTLEHIASCNKCAASYVEMIENSSMIKAPHYMKDNILKKSKELAEYQKLSEIKEKQKPSNRIQLFRYSLKVGLAMCGALAMIFVSSFGNSPTLGISFGKVDTGQLEADYSVESFVNNVNYGLREFSNNMVQYADTLVSNNRYDMEENGNDEEKK